MGAAGPSVLIIDDLGANRTLYAAFCTKVGFVDVRTAENSSIAVRIISEHKGSIDMVLLDIQLPDVNGLKLLQLLRSTPGCADIPVVMITASNADTDWTQAYDAGADDYLVKPITMAKCRFLKRLALNMRTLRQLKRRERERDEANAPAPVDVAKRLQNEVRLHYGEDLDLVMSRHNNSGTAMSLIFIHPLRNELAHQKLLKAARAALLSASSYQAARLLSRRDGEFLVVLPQDDVERANQWLGMIRGAWQNLFITDGSAQTQQTAFSYNVVTLKAGEMPTIDELVLRLAPETEKS